MNFDPIKRGEFCPDKKGEILNFDPVTSLKLLIYPFFVSFCKRSSLRSQTFLCFRTLHLAYPKLVRTPCTWSTKVAWTVFFDKRASGEWSVVNGNPTKILFYYTAYFFLTLKVEREKKGVQTSSIFLQFF